LLERAIASLYDTASDPGNVEVLVRYDNDDLSVLEAAEVCGLNWDHPWIDIIGEPHGYTGMATYYNELAATASGDWLLIFNDDALMQTPGWDAIIESRGPGLKNLSIDNNHGRAYACFPCVPKRWFDICGHLALDTRVDSWLQQVAQATDCFVEENDVFILHDRYDLTGNNDDETFRRRYIDAEFWTSFDSPENQATRGEDVRRIREAMGAA
jgi:hypothetical protein